MWMNQHQYSETSSREALWGWGHLDCLSSGNSPPYKQRCGKAGVMARVIPSKETKKWETVHQLGQEAWLLRLSSLYFGASGLGQAGWGEKYPCHRQLELSAEIYQQHRPRPHLCSWGLLIVVKSSRDRERKNLFYAKLTVKLWNTSNKLHLKEVLHLISIWMSLILNDMVSYNIPHLRLLLLLLLLLSSLL